MISIFVASCDRAEMLRNMLRSLWKTTKEHEIEVVLVLDGYTDEDIFTFIGWSSGDFLLDFASERRGALQCWNRGLRLATGDILVPAGDDQIFHDGWLDYALESHASLGGYGVVGMNDLAYNEEQVATMFLFDREYCKREMGGIFAPPMYNYLCVDLEWNEKAKMLGKFKRDMRAKVEHLHSAHGKREYDQHDKWKDESNLYEADTKTYKERLSKGFPIEWSPLI